MKRNTYKEYLKKQKMKDKYDEEFIVNEESMILKIIFFIFDILSRFFNVLFYLGLIILCSIGATFLANKFGIINIFWEGGISKNEMVKTNTCDL